ncbi:MAG TPA: hypothetical protein VGJ81_05280 [Thermoanaerobaculia bacterium]|jgi:hypothetical protein
MASKFYEKIAANYQGFAQPGVVVHVVENDGGIGLEMAAENDWPQPKNGLSAFFNVDEARELVSAIESAIRRAEPKSAAHPRRVKDVN